MVAFADALNRLWPHGDSKVPGLRAGIIASAPAVFAKYGITTPLLVAHVMAQGSHECGAGTEVIENINYTPERACEVWPSRFRSVAQCYAVVGSFAGDPQFKIKLIDSVYGNRMGNRPGTHDGSAYIGRGFSQTTGREGYERLSGEVGLDLISHPEYLTDPRYFLECGVADFILCGCLPYAKIDDLLHVTTRLNGGTVGLAQRADWLARWKAALGDTPIVLGAPPRVILPAPPAPPDVSKPAPAPPSITSPAKGSIGAFFASIFAAIFGRK